MLTVIGLLKMKPSPNGERHGEQPFWRESGIQYLEAWLGGIAEHVPNPKRIVVMTDSELAFDVPRQLTEDRVELTFIPLAEAVDAPGWWAKLNMFRPDVSRGKCLYLDLDNLLCGSIAELCALEPNPMIMMDDRNVPRLPNGSTMLFDAERCRFLWDRYARFPRELEGAFVVKNGDYAKAFDQAFIAENIERTSYGADPRLFQDLLPRGYCLNAYSELPDSEDWRDARLIFGCGAAKPHTSTHRVFRENWSAR